MMLECLNPGLQLEADNRKLILLAAFTSESNLSVNARNRKLKRI